MAKAYLVGFLQKVTVNLNLNHAIVFEDQPRFSSLGIFSGPAGSTTVNMKTTIAFDIAQSEAETFEEAEKKLKDMVREYYPWLYNSIK
jgi:hypothetical protein